jgi:hypothetical protein
MRPAMKKSILKKKNWVFLETIEDFERFLDSLDAEWEARAESRQDTFSDWVNHYYQYLLKDLGPSNSAFYS